jgi:4-hydroxybenzoyl-CoA reductase subunit beta
MKHRLFTPRHLVALKSVAEMRGITLADAAGAPLGEDAAGAAQLVIGAAETLTTVAAHPLVRRLFPSLAQAAAQVAGPQIRNAGTLGGNLCLDTRCTYYNQSFFWRQALGFCLKKEGTVCHVTRVGKKCVAAHSADTPPVLITLGASLELAGPEGVRSVGVDEFFVADGVWNTTRRRDEVLVRIRIPLPAAGTRMAYRKVRQRNAVDFPLLSLAAAAQLAPDQSLRSLALVVSALGARPRVVSGLEKLVAGRRLDEAAEGVAAQAFKQCHPLENIIVDPDWRRAMVPVYVRRLLADLAGADPAA